MITDRPDCPAIAPVAVGVHRPFWSVMIPAVGRIQYLAETLNSVLCQDPGEHEMQIEVVDNSGEVGAVEELVLDIGRGRVAYHRQPVAVPMSDNWNTCLDRAHGRWIHLLHDDDVVRSGFYRQFREVLETTAEIGAAFCRFLRMDEDGHWESIAPLERRTAGLLDDWIASLAVFQRVQAPSIVVRRDVYEKLGGFHRRLRYAADWEMWKRIAVFYPVWYEPTPLACYRMSAMSSTAALRDDATTVTDTRKAIEIAHAYLAPSDACGLTARARERCALDALHAAIVLVSAARYSAALAHAREALRTSRTWRVYRRLMRLTVHFTWLLVARPRALP